MSLLNKVHQVPKCKCPTSAQVQVPEWSSVLVLEVPKCISALQEFKCPGALSARVPKCPWSAL